MSQIIGPTGQVFAVERIPELVKIGRNNCKKIGIQNVKFFQAGEQFGLIEYSPYDRILVSASSDRLPKELLSQLKVGGKLVIPVLNDVLEIMKTSECEFDTEIHPGFVFVPLL
jgi:protein-L-isoaspartate(D-aspartate) O-methyltransferase